MLYLQLINYFQKLNRILLSTFNINFKLPRLYIATQLIVRRGQTLYQGINQNLFTGGGGKGALGGPM